MSSIHLELLDKKRRETFEKLKIFQKKAILGGGTALSLQINHRQSFDFDLFLERLITKRDLQKLKKTFGIKKVEINNPEQLSIITAESVGITLVYFERKSLFQKIPTSSLSLFAIKDIAADKAYTIGRRALWRDYVDLFFILKWEYTDIFELIKLGERKFGVEFNAKLFLEQLVYFKDLERQKISFIKEGPSVREIQDYLRRQVENFSQVELK